MANIKLKISINTTQEELWRAVTTREGLSSWWTTKCTVKAELGHMNVFNFEKGYFVKFHVDDMNPRFSVRWTCIEGIEEWQGTELKFEIWQREDSCDLILHHNLWHAETEYFASCTYQWAKFLDSLKAYSETGKGSPFQAN